MDGAYNPFVSCNLIKDKFEKMKKKKKKGKEKRKDFFQGSLQLKYFRSLCWPKALPHISSSLPRASVFQAARVEEGRGGLFFFLT